MSAKSNTILFAAFLTIAIGASAQAVPAQPKANSVVFQIGQFDRSSNEFPGGTPERPVNFIVGKSVAAKDWYAMQNVVVVPASSTLKTPPRTIHFSLEGKQSPSYELHLAFLIESNAVPAIRVGINGKQGTFYLHPR